MPRKRDEDVCGGPARLGQLRIAAVEEVRGHVRAVPGSTVAIGRFGRGAREVPGLHDVQGAAGGRGEPPGGALRAEIHRRRKRLRMDHHAAATASWKKRVWERV